MPSREEEVKTAYESWKTARRTARKVARLETDPGDFAIRLATLYAVADQMLWEEIRVESRSGAGRKQVVRWCGDNRELYRIMSQEDRNERLQ